MSQKFCTGVKDPRCYPKISVWVYETRGVIQKALLPKRIHNVMVIT